MQRDFFFFYPAMDGILEIMMEDTKRNKIELDWSWIEIVLLRRRIYVRTVSLYFRFQKELWLQ